MADQGTSESDGRIIEEFGKRRARGLLILVSAGVLGVCVLFVKKSTPDPLDYAVVVATVSVLCLMPFYGILRCPACKAVVRYFGVSTCPKCNIQLRP